jgi:glutamate-1-semialdehyde 2,1-aminomutase
MCGVRPDLLSVGKAMANGYALSAVLGPRRHMERGGLDHSEDRVFFLSTTNGPERSALAACRATIRFYREHDVIGHLARTGRRVSEALREAATDLGIADRLYAYGDHSARPFFATLDRDGRPSAAFRTLFVQETLRAGIFMPWICPSYRHGAAELERTADAFRAAARVYAQALERGSTSGLLEGPPMRPVFRRRNSDPA